MASNRELLAQEITKRFIGAISGTDEEKIVGCRPEDKIFVGKLSSKREEAKKRNNDLITSISLDFRISRRDLPKTKLKIYPQGSFFFMVMPTLSQQRGAFMETLKSRSLEQPIHSFEELLSLGRAGRLPEQVEKMEVRLLPVYKKFDMDKDNISFAMELADICGEQLQEKEDFVVHGYEVDTAVHVSRIQAAVLADSEYFTSQLTDKVRLQDLLDEDTWKAYGLRQKNRQKFKFLPTFAYNIAINVEGNGKYVDVTVALENDTFFQQERGSFRNNASRQDPHRINTMFHAGLRVQYAGAELVPLEMSYFADDYKYDKNIYASGNNCNAVYDAAAHEISTVSVPVYIQHRLKTNDALAVKFADLIEAPVATLQKIASLMQVELASWQKDYRSRRKLTPEGKKQFEKEIQDFAAEVQRFTTGVELIRDYPMLRRAFVCMNRVFRRSAKGYDSWRLFQIVFVVSLLLDVVAHEPELHLPDRLRQDSKMDWVDVLYFPTGGGKTEAFLGILVFNLFFDRIRGKAHGVTALLKYPLRLLSVQQVQRVANILATAEQLRQEEKLAGDAFALGYFVGDQNTPNKIDASLRDVLLTRDQAYLDGAYRLLDICPFCKQETVHVIYDRNVHGLRHVCTNAGCPSGGMLTLYMVDYEIYRFLPSVIISTVDKMAAMGVNARFRNLLWGSEYRCPVHGFAFNDKCPVEIDSCDASVLESVHMKDPAPTLLIQDELHLIKESLGTYASHYETMLEYAIKELSGCGRGIKVIGATATIASYAEQAAHLYGKRAIRFPAASPYLDHNFYSFTDSGEISRLILGYTPEGPSSFTSVAHSLQYLRRVVAELLQQPEQIVVLPGMALTGTAEEKLQAAQKLMEDYWVILEYNNVKMDSNKVVQLLSANINEALAGENIQPFSIRKMTGDDKFQEVRATLSELENTSDVIHDLDYNMIAATSMISHGVDAKRFNLMLFFGIPGSTAEYIQAYSRVGRSYPGIVIDVMRPERKKEASILKNFTKIHEYKDIFVEPVAINRWAAKAVEKTLPGLVSALLLNYYAHELAEAGDITKYGALRRAILQGKITADSLKAHLWRIYKCHARSLPMAAYYKEAIDRGIDDLLQKFIRLDCPDYTYLTGALDKCSFHVMTSLRDTDEQVVVKLR